MSAFVKDNHYFVYTDLPGAVKPVVRKLIPQLDDLMQKKFPDNSWGHIGWMKQSDCLPFEAVLGVMRIGGFARMKYLDGFTSPWYTLKSQPIDPDDPAQGAAFEFRTLLETDAPGDVQIDGLNYYIDQEPTMLSTDLIAGYGWEARLREPDMHV